jgi:hypothetical protein
MKIRTKTPLAATTVKSILSAQGIECRIDNPTNLTVLNAPSEAIIRQRLQNKLDTLGFNYTSDFVLVEGNSIYSYVKIMTELLRIKKAGNTEKISKYFYEFMHLNFTIAHYDINGWKYEYPNYVDVKSILHTASVPHWKTDVRLIVDTFKNNF